MTPRRPHAGCALLLAYAAAIASGIAVALAARSHPTAAIVTVLAAAAFTLTALVWALRRENRR